MHACRPIRRGEEITFNYSGVLQPRAERRSQLLQDFGFECTCAKCSLSGEELQASEERIATIVSPSSELASNGSLWELVHVNASTLLGRLDARYELMLQETHRVYAARSPSRRCGGAGRQEEEEIPPSPTEQVISYPLADLIFAGHAENCTAAAARLSEILRHADARPGAANPIFTDQNNGGQRVSVPLKGLREKAAAFTLAAGEWAARARDMESTLWAEDFEEDQEEVEEVEAEAEELEVSSTYAATRGAEQPTMTDGSRAVRGVARADFTPDAVTPSEDEAWRSRARRQVLSGESFFEEDGLVWLRTSAQADDDLAGFAALAECGHASCACTRSLYPHVRRHFREGVVRRAMAARASGASALARGCFKPSSRKPSTQR